MAAILKVRLPDGSVVDIPAIVGPNGPTGVGIQSITLKSSDETGNTYTVTLTDGSAYELIAPSGPAGKPGEGGGIVGVFDCNITITSAFFAFANGSNPVKQKSFEDALKLRFYNGGGEEITDHALVFAELLKPSFVPFATKLPVSSDHSRYQLALKDFSVTADGKPLSVKVSGHDRMDGFIIHIVYTYDYDNLDENGNPTQHSVTTLTQSYEKWTVTMLDGTEKEVLVEVLNR